MTYLKQLVIWMNDERMTTPYLICFLLGLIIVFYLSISTKPPNLGHWCHNYVGVRFSHEGQMHPICLKCLRDMNEVKMSGVPVKDL